MPEVEQSQGPAPLPAAPAVRTIDPDHYYLESEVVFLFRIPLARLKRAREEEGLVYLERQRGRRSYLGSRLREWMERGGRPVGGQEGGQGGGSDLATDN